MIKLFRLKNPFPKYPGSTFFNTPQKIFLIYNLKAAYVLLLLVLFLSQKERKIGERNWMFSLGLGAFALRTNVFSAQSGGKCTTAKSVLEKEVFKSLVELVMAHVCVSNSALRFRELIWLQCWDMSPSEDDLKQRRHIKLVWFLYLSIQWIWK